MSLKHILVFIMLNYLVLFLINYPILLLVKKITFKWALVLSGLFSTIAYYYLLIQDLNLTSLIIIAFVSSVGINLYYAAKHDYALRLLPNRNMGDEVGSMIIFVQLGLIPASLIGALLLQNIDKTFLIIITLLIYLASIVPLFGIKSKRIRERIILKNVFIKLPRKSFWFYVLNQFRVISKTIFPLYIFIYLKTNFEYIGIFNLFVSLSGIFFVYFFSRKMDKDKKDYLVLSGLLGALAYILKLNIIDSLLLLVVAFFEGLVDRMYDTAYNRNLYALGKQFDKISYIGFLEGMQNMVRVVIMLIFIYLIKDIRLFLYISALMLILTGLNGYDDGEGGY